MLKLEVNIHDQVWPLVVITVTRQSYRQGQVVQQAKVPYDLAYGKLEEMLHNQGRPLVEELVSRHQTKR